MIGLLVWWCCCAAGKENLFLDAGESWGLHTFKNDPEQFVIGWLARARDSHSRLQGFFALPGVQQRCYKDQRIKITAVNQKQH